MLRNTLKHEIGIKKRKWISWWDELVPVSTIWCGHHGSCQGSGLPALAFAQSGQTSMQ